MNTFIRGPFACAVMAGRGVRRVATIGVLFAAANASATAAAPEDVARAKGCLACHAVDAKIVGPAYKDVAAKYAGQADAEDKLAAKVQKGGGGVWGFVPMPPNTGVNEEEAHVLVKWILSNPTKPAP